MALLVVGAAAVAIYGWTWSQPPAGRGHITVHASELPASRRVRGSTLTLQSVSREADGRFRFTLNLKERSSGNKSRCAAGDSAVYAGRFASRSSASRGQPSGSRFDVLFWVPPEARSVAFCQEMRAVGASGGQKVEFRDVTAASADVVRKAGSLSLTLRRVHGNVRMDYRRWQLTGEHRVMQGEEVFAVEIEEQYPGVLDGTSPALLTDDRGRTVPSVAVLNDAWYTAKLVKEAIRVMPDVYDRDPESTIGILIHLPTGMRLAERRFQRELELAAKRVPLPEKRIYIWPAMHPPPKTLSLSLKTVPPLDGPGSVWVDFRDVQLP